MAHIARDLNDGEVASIRKEFKGKKIQGKENAGLARNDDPVDLE